MSDPIEVPTEVPVNLHELELLPEVTFEDLFSPRRLNALKAEAYHKYISAHPGLPGALPRSGFRGECTRQLVQRCKQVLSDAGVPRFSKENSENSRLTRAAIQVPEVGDFEVEFIECENGGEVDFLRMCETARHPSVDLRLGKLAMSNGQQVSPSTYEERNRLRSINHYQGWGLRLALYEPEEGTEDAPDTIISGEESKGWTRDDYWSETHLIYIANYILTNGEVILESPETE